MAAPDVWVRGLSNALCIAWDAVPGVLPQKLQAIAGTGFNSVELAAGDLAGQAGGPDEIRKLVGEHGMKISLLACDTALGTEIILEPVRGLSSGQLFHVQQTDAGFGKLR